MVETHNYKFGGVFLNGCTPILEIGSIKVS
jgi:hypothetical protein